MKRLASFLFIFVIVFTLLTGTVFAAAPAYTDDVTAQYWMLIDADSGMVLDDSGNVDKQIEPASTTKIMTCILALEKGNLSDTVIVSRKAAGISGSTCNLVEGEEINLENLLNAMMMVSGNDAATAVAEHISGSASSYVDMMNAKAQELGMTSTHFYNVHGKHTEEGDHHTTVADMAKLAIYAMKNPTFMGIVDKSSYTLPADNKRQSQLYKNTNKLCDRDSEYYYSAANGMKTGSTNFAGGCLVASASKNGMNLIALLFKDDSQDGRGRWPDARSLFEFGFDNYRTVDLQELLVDVKPVQAQVENYAANDVSEGLLEFAGPEPGMVYKTLPKDVVEGLLNGTDSLEPVPTFTSPLQAPILKGSILGTVQYKSKNTGEVVCSDNLVATRDVLQAGTEPNASGGTAVATQPPIIPEKLKTQRDNSGIWLWLLIPAGLIVFLVFRLFTVNRKKRKRYSTRRKPQYSYKIRR